MYRAITILLAAVVLAVLLRGPLYRAVVHYEVIGRRGNSGVVPPSTGLGRVALNMDDLIDAVLDSTADRLHFSTGRVSNDPGALLRNGGAANCIGYAALFKAILEQELASAGQADAYAVEQVIGQLHIGERNLHNAFDSPFWKDHDIVRIVDRRNGKVIHVDPSLYDAVGIGRVTGPSDLVHSHGPAEAVNGGS